MPSIPQEQPPLDVDVNLKEYLSRMFINIGIALRQVGYNQPVYVLPDKPQVGQQVYFAQAIPPDITGEGLWLYKSTGWVLIG